MDPVSLYRPGQLVPGTDLKVIEFIGSGGMGSVYAVEEMSGDATFVMKVMHPQLLLENADRMRERMRREARTLARLDHKNIVRVYRGGLTGDVPPLPFYVMDMLSGFTLRQVLRWNAKRRLVLPRRWLFRFGSSLLSALEHAHDHGVVHRDVKPDNIFLHQGHGDRTIVLKLLDFGVMATMADLSAAGHPRWEGFAGTYSHAAPEQLQGQVPSPAMDLYSAGVVFYEMLSGSHPFCHHRRADALIHAHLHEVPPPIAEGHRVHPRLADLVLQMLAKHPSQRPGSARTIFDALARIEQDWIAQDARPAGADFQFDIAMGKPWPTNAGFLQEEPLMDSSVDDAHAGAAPLHPSRRDRFASHLSSRSLLASPELAGVKPLEIRSSDQSRGSEPAHATRLPATDGRKAHRSDTAARTRRSTMEFVCPDPKALVRAANVRATLDAFNLLPRVGRDLIERHNLNIDELKSNKFILVQRWLDALREIQREVGPSVLRQVGVNIVENADIPPTFKDAEEMVLAANDLYRKNHKGDVGQYVISRKGDESIEVRCETPYPRMFEYGLIEGFCRNKRFAFPRKYHVEYTEGAPGSNVTCTLVVRRLV